VVAAVAALPGGAVAGLVNFMTWGGVRAEPILEVSIVSAGVVTYCLLTYISRSRCRQKFLQFTLRRLLGGVFIGALLVLLNCLKAPPSNLEPWAPRNRIWEYGWPFSFVTLYGGMQDDCTNPLSLSIDLLFCFGLVLTFFLVMQDLRSVHSERADALPMNDQLAPESLFSANAEPKRRNWFQIVMLVLAAGVLVWLNAAHSPAVGPNPWHEYGWPITFLGYRPAFLQWESDSEFRLLSLLIDLVAAVMLLRLTAFICEWAGRRRERQQP
jgi:hypothetical protein